MRTGKINGIKQSFGSTPPAYPGVGDIWYRYIAGKLISHTFWNGAKWVTPDQESRRVESVTTATGFIGRLSVPGLSGHKLNVLAWGFAGSASFTGSDSYLMTVTSVKPAFYTFSNFSIVNSNYQEVEGAVVTGSPVNSEGLGNFRFTGTKSGSASSTFSVDGSFFVRYRYEYEP